MPPCLKYGKSVYNFSRSDKATGEQLNPEIRKPKIYYCHTIRYFDTYPASKRQTTSLLDLAIVISLKVSGEIGNGGTYSIKKKTKRHLF